jgi:hypothetical protein
MSDYDARPLWHTRLLEQRFSPGQRLLARALAELVAADGRGTVSVGQLVDRTGLSRATVKRAIARLIEERWLVRLVRGGFTPTRVRLSVWQLRTPDDPSMPVDNGLKGSSSAVRSPGSRAHSEPFTPGSRAHFEPVRGVKGSVWTPSRAQSEPLPLGGKDEDEEASSLGVSLTSAGGASLAAAPTSGVVSPDEANAVLQAIPEVLRGRDMSENDDQRYLVMERLANGCSVVQLIEDSAHAAAAAQRVVIGRGHILTNPVGWWAKHVRRHPAPPKLSEVPWCGECDREGEHSASGRWRELGDGRYVRCWMCHPTEVQARQRQVAHLDRMAAAG